MQRKITTTFKRDSHEKGTSGFRFTTKDRSDFQWEGLQTIRYYTENLEQWESTSENTFLAPPVSL